MDPVLAVLPRRVRIDQRLPGRDHSFLELADRRTDAGACPTIRHSFASTSPRTVARLVVQGPYSLEVTHWPSGTPLGPESTIRDTFHWGVVIPAGDRRAIVGGFSGLIIGFDLEKMVTPTPASADELTVLAELAAGRRIMSEGRVVPISSTEWTDRWERLQRLRAPFREVCRRAGKGTGATLTGKAEQLN